MNKKSILLGELLIEKGYISSDQLRIALVEQKKTGKKLGETLSLLGFLSGEQIIEVVGHSIGHGSMSLSGVVPDIDTLCLITEIFARNNLIMPISLEGNGLKLAMVNPDDIILIDKVERYLNRKIKIIPVLVTAKEIQEAIDCYYGYELSIDGIINELEAGQVDNYSLSLQDEYSHPMVRLVDSILTDSVRRGASDIHFEPEESYIRIRYRIDGVLQEIRLLHKSLWSSLVVRLKVISKLDLTEQFLPQDGGMSLTVLGRSIDFRTSSLPGRNGENFVLRVLDRDKGVVPLESLGFDSTSFRELKQMMARPNGILFITGPTGSGKTTTLYSMLNELNKMSVNIITLEDPVEYPMPLIRQTEINEVAGLTFATGIRSLLRQDPDIILIGEIRDGETAEMALKAAMTGHQVFTTLHANSAVGSIPRLLDIGVSRSILSGNIIGIVSQRLVRKLCPECKKPYAPKDSEKKLLGLSSESTLVLYKSCGCGACHQQGYKGRLAILEALKFSEKLDALLLDGSSQIQILEVALEQGFSTMVHSGLRRVKSGETTLDEIGRVVDLTELM